MARGSQQVARLQRPCPGVVCLGREKVAPLPKLKGTQVLTLGSAYLCGTCVELRRNPSISLATVLASKNPSALWFPSDFSLEQSPPITQLLSLSWVPASFSCGLV